MKKLFFTILGLLFLFPAYSQAQGVFFNSDTVTKMKDLASDVAGNGGYVTTGANNMGAIIAQVLVGFYAVLGIIFLIFIILAGWKYMNARGDEKKTQEALDQIKNAVIGLIIILAAYSITWFVFYYMPWGGGGGIGGPGGSP